MLVAFAVHTLHHGVPSQHALVHSSIHHLARFYQRWRRRFGLGSIGAGRIVGRRVVVVRRPELDLHSLAGHPSGLAGAEPGTAVVDPSGAAEASFLEWVLVFDHTAPAEPSTSVGLVPVVDPSELATLASESAILAAVDRVVETELSWASVLAPEPLGAASTAFDLAVAASGRIAVLVLALYGLVAFGLAVAALGSGPAVVVEVFDVVVGRGIADSTGCSY